MYTTLSGSEEDKDLFNTSVLSDSKRWVVIKFVSYANVLLVKTALSFLIGQAVAQFYIISIMFRAIFCFFVFLAYSTRE